MKKIKMINKLLIFLSFIVNTICLVMTLIGNYDSNVLVCLSYYVLAILPIVLIKFKININDMIEFVYLLFIILACLMGSVLHFYGMIHCYDSIIHYLSGILTSLLGFLLLIKFNKFENRAYVFNILYIVFVTLSVAACWEIFEFTADNLLNGNAQKVLETGVTDTMKDVICAFMGSLLVSICYVYEFVENKKWIVTKIIQRI